MISDESQARRVGLGAGCAGDDRTELECLNGRCNLVEYEGVGGLPVGHDEQQRGPIPLLFRARLAHFLLRSIQNVFERFTKQGGARGRADNLRNRCVLKGGQRQYIFDLGVEVVTER